MIDTNYRLAQIEANLVATIQPIDAVTPAP